MEFKQVITGRRSIRQFKDTPITDQQVAELLESVRIAPSAKNRQPWKLVVLRGGGQRRCGGHNAGMGRSQPKPPNQRQANGTGNQTSPSLDFNLLAQGRGLAKQRHPVNWRCRRTHLPDRDRHGAGLALDL